MPLGILSHSKSYTIVPKFKQNSDAFSYGVHQAVLKELLAARRREVHTSPGLLPGSRQEITSETLLGAKLGIFNAFVGSFLLGKIVKKPFQKLER